MEKISQIFMYQMQIQNKDSLKWRIIYNELKKMIKNQSWHMRVDLKMKSRRTLSC